jgi:ribosome maturation factor RimP
MNGDGRRSLETAFERAALGLPHEAEFREVEIVAHRAQRHGRTTELVLTVDRTGGVDLALCERIAARLNALLQTEPEGYTLEVESPGLDRRLGRPADFERFRGENVRISTTLPIERRRTHRGKLLGVRGNAVILETAEGEFPIPLEMLKSANIEYDYRADLRREKRERREKR